jgi:hypothetical protein
MIGKAIATAERIARRAIPDIGSQPLYIGRASDSMLMRAALAGCDGRYVHGLDQALRPQLEREGRWLGPGVAVACDVDAIVRDYAADEFAIERAIVGTTLHELCHWLRDDGPPADAADGPSISAGIVAKAAERSADPTTRWPHAIFSHDSGFIRACCHVWYRCNSPRGCDYFMRAHHLAFASSYRTLEAMSPPRAYCHSLSDEIQLRQHWPIRDILQTEAPGPFRDLWRADENRVFAAAMASAVA